MQVRIAEYYTTLDTYRNNTQFLCYPKEGPMLLNRTGLSGLRWLSVIAVVSLLVAGWSTAGFAQSAEAIWTLDPTLYCKHVETAYLNADDVIDVIASEYSNDYYDSPSKVYALDGLTGDTIWTYQLQDGARSMTIGDISNDGTVDVIIGASYNTSGTADGMVHAIDGKDGTQLWTYSIGSTIQSVVVGNFNGDVYLDVAAAAFDDYIYAIDGHDGSLLWDQLIGSLWVNDLDAGDVNSDNIDDIAYAHEYLTGFTNYIGVLNGASGLPIWDETVSFISTDAMLEDIDNDGSLEAIFGVLYDDDHGEITVRDAATGAVEWSYDLGTVDHYNGEVLLFAHDVDENGDLDLVVARYLGSNKLIVFDGDEPSPMFESEALSGYPRDVAFGDVTGNGTLNMIVAVYDRVQVLKAIGGVPVWYYSVAGTMASVGVGDFDDDGVLDVAAAGGADISGSDPGKGVWALRTVASQVLWEYDFGSYGNELALGDLNNDGCADAVVVNSSGHNATAINGANGQLLWQWTASDNLFAVTIGDFNGDGQNDVAVGGYDHVVTGLDGADGSILWQFTNGTDDYYRKSIKSMDVNSDGNVDVIAGCESNIVYAIDGESGDELWSTDCGGTVNEVRIFDVEGDGTAEVLVGVGGSAGVGRRVCVLNASDGLEKWHKEVANAVEHIAGAHSFVSGNDIYDIAVAVTPYSSQIAWVNGDAPHNEEWATPIDIASNSQSIATGDVNSDGWADVAVPGRSGDMRVTVLDGNTGLELWHYVTGGEVNTVLIADVDLDGFNEVIAGSDDQNVYVLDGATGDLEWSYSTADDVIHLDVADVNCDGNPNIVCCTFGSDGVVYAFRSLAVSPNQAPATPEQPFGEIEAITQYTYAYSTFTADPDDDDVYYKWEVDAVEGAWEGPYSSGETAKLYRQWTIAGPHAIRVKARDALDQETGWSSPLDVTVFECGNVNGAGGIDIDDIVFLIEFVFQGGTAPQPENLGDVDCVGGVDIDDIVYLIAYVFQGGALPCADC